jgi:hypothetical protein
LKKKVEENHNIKISVKKDGVVISRNNYWKNEKLPFNFVSKDFIFDNFEFTKIKL